MSLYYDAATILSEPTLAGSLKSRVYGRKDLKSPPPQVFALVSETVRWNLILKEVINNAQLLKWERKLSPVLALLLVHDLLLAKGGIAAAASNPLRLATERHKARLQADFTRIRLKRGYASIAALKRDLAGSNRYVDRTGTSPPSWHPRWVRINTLRTSLMEQMQTTFDGWTIVSTLAGLESAEPTTLHIDPHVADLIALPASTDLNHSSAYQKGELIFQEKASCFPAMLLDLTPDDGDVIDACAAPGNKTTHLAALLASNMDPTKDRRKQHIWAIERDKARAETLYKMVKSAGAQALTSVKAGQDFLRLDPQDPSWADVGALLLDPSCSGSGIIGRDDTWKLTLPEAPLPQVVTQKSKHGKRATRISIDVPEPLTPAEKNVPEENPPSNAFRERLTALSSFQLKLLLHAFRFPSAHKITYSTCSIHEQENEQVVVKALQSSLAQQLGWRILHRGGQVPGMRTWNTRGDVRCCGRLMTGAEEAKKLAEACIRCNKDEDGMMGFFVAAFVRKDSSMSRGNKTVNPSNKDSAEATEDDGEEWQGFSDDD
ncbi:MAG: hypothetical protein M1817_002385 [Caeruleum heppii]|nr:MAG: hypothetical protein M1817_002385 [Caeruleum heppii]